MQIVPACVQIMQRPLRRTRPLWQNESVKRGKGGEPVKIRVIADAAQRAEIEAWLREKGVDTGDDGELLLTCPGAWADRLMGRDGGNLVPIPTAALIGVESCGHEVTARTADGVFRLQERLVQLERMLDPEKFMRVSSSAIIARDRVRRITPTLFQKFILTMEGGWTVDVTRSYYQIFRDAFGI